MIEILENLGQNLDSRAPRALIGTPRGSVLHRLAAPISVSSVPQILFQQVTGWESVFPDRLKRLETAGTCLRLYNRWYKDLDDRNP